MKSMKSIALGLAAMVAMVESVKYDTSTGGVKKGGTYSKITMTNKQQKSRNKAKAGRKASKKK